MNFKNVCVESVAYHLPENVVSSEEIEKRLSPVYDRLKLPYGRLEMMSGIKERRFWDKGAFPSQVSSIAGEKAIVQSGIDRSEIGCLICASVCRDFLEPATASVIHNNLKLSPDIQLFDVSNACLGVLNSMIIVGNMIEQGQIKAGLIVSGENGGPLVDSTIEDLIADSTLTRSSIKLAFASLTIGSGAAAILLTHKDLSKDKHKLLGGASMAATQHNDLCRGSEDSGVHSEASPLMQTDSETLMKEGCKLAGATWGKAKQELGWTNETPIHVFCHQVGQAQRKLMYETVQLDMQKDFSTLEFLGNIGSASLPTTLGMGVEQVKPKSGDKLALLGIGSGLNCFMLGVEW
jgi:acyl-CoA:acyl-CoA alkyltransferase